MTARAEPNACSACARSKRKCGRQMPACARCKEKGSACVYSSLKTRVISLPRVLLASVSRDRAVRCQSGEVGNSAPSPVEELVHAEDITFPPTDSNFIAPSSLTHKSNTPVSRVEWFLAPETWTIIHRLDTSADVAISTRTMERYIVVLQSWFARWVATGSSPFIHARLYSAHFPACLQVAYTTLASYIHRTPLNTKTVLQIVEDRSNALLQANGATLDMVGPEVWNDDEKQDVDLFAQLARLHALMVYQIIGLFDGDIRARYVAEGHIAVQNSWAGKLFASAGKLLSTSHAVATHLVGYLPRFFSQSQEQWYLWTLSESIRRTWLVAGSMSPVYFGIQQRLAACPGGVMYTNRSGLWGAVSAAEWEKLCLGKNMAFLQRFGYQRLLGETEPADIDEFGMTMLDMTFDEELVIKWKEKSGG